MARKGWAEGQHRGTDNSSPGADLEHQRNRSLDLPYQACKEALETIQHLTVRCTILAGKQETGNPQVVPYESPPKVIENDCANILRPSDSNRQDGNGPPTVHCVS